MESCECDRATHIDSEHSPHMEYIFVMRSIYRVVVVVVGGDDKNISKQCKGSFRSLPFDAQAFCGRRVFHCVLFCYKYFPFAALSLSLQCLDTIVNRLFPNPRTYYSIENREWEADAPRMLPFTKICFHRL